jgi:hypothetical protein
MACVKKSEGSGQSFPGGYATEQECLEKCKMGACCLGLRCAVVPSCACAKAGGTFLGEGTTCSRSTQKQFLRNDFTCCYPFLQGCQSATPVTLALAVTDTFDAVRQGDCRVNISGIFSVTLEPDSNATDCGVYYGTPSVPAICYQLQFQSGVAPLVLSAVFSIVSGQPKWRATIETTSVSGSYSPNGQNILATGFGGPPCTTATEWSPAGGCYSGGAGLYRFVGGSSGAPCASRWVSVGSVTIGVP